MSENVWKVCIFAISPQGARYISTQPLRFSTLQEVPGENQAMGTGMCISVPWHLQGGGRWMMEDA